MGDIGEDLRDDFDGEKELAGPFVVGDNCDGRFGFGRRFTGGLDGSLEGLGHLDIPIGLLIEGHVDVDEGQNSRIFADKL